jgi:alpha-tubulin suppressor-like RCC1 family protein
MEWGNGDPIARTHSDLFNYDRPIKYDIGGNNLVILTERGIIYKLNLEKKTNEKIGDHSSEGTDLGIEQLACGSDFIITLKSDGNVYSMGGNKCGQLGVWDLKPRDQFALVDTLLNSNIKQIIAGN